MTMPTFRKKPVEIEARQLTKESGPELWEWADSKPLYGPTGQVEGLRIYTLEGDMRADFGDWIIRGVQGEFYPCKPDIFEATYQPADAAPVVTDAMVEAFGEAWEATPAGAPGVRRRAGLAAALAVSQ